MNSKHSIALAMFAFAAIALVGCKNNLDSTKLEGSITEGLKAKEVTLTSIKCPADRPIKMGDKFDCDGVLPDGAGNAKFHVEQKDDQGNITWKLDGALVNQSKIGHLLEADLGKGSVVKCPSKVVVLKKGDKFECDYTHDGTTGKIEIVAKDDDGNVETNQKPHT